MFPFFNDLKFRRVHINYQSGTCGIVTKCITETGFHCEENSIDSSPFRFYIQSILFYLSAWITSLLTWNTYLIIFTANNTGNAVEGISDPRWYLICQSACQKCRFQRQELDNCWRIYKLLTKSFSVTGHLMMVSASVEFWLFNKSLLWVCPIKKCVFMLLSVCGRNWHGSYFRKLFVDGKETYTCLSLQYKLIMLCISKVDVFQGYCMSQ